MTSLFSLPILSQQRIAPGIYSLELSTEGPFPARPGQFVDLKIPGKMLRRPISITDITEDRLILTYRVAGEGTAILSGMKPGEVLEILGPLGKGFVLPEESSHLLMVGGGIGTPPLIYLAKEALRQGHQVTVLFGFRSPADTLFQEELKAMGVDYHFAYDSEGENVVQLMQRLGLDDLPFFACGPMPMLKALCKAGSSDGQCSLEARMGCGFGACMGCSIKTRNGMQRVCKEGPVFSKEVLLWET